NNNKKNLQDQIAKLNNEIEELRLEREESKKNVLHFMQEADTARHELSETKQWIKELKRCTTTPPLSSTSSTSSDTEEEDTISLLLLHDPKSPFDMTKKSDETEMQSKLNQYQLENAELADELDQLRHEYQATRQALHIENERAETIENRWKESENNLEQAEITIAQLNHDLERYRQLDWSMRLANKEESDAINRNEVESWKKRCQDAVDQAESTGKMLLERECEVGEWKERYDALYHERVSFGFCFDQKCEIDKAKIKENHLRTVNRSLRDELRKVTKAQENAINIAYLRNVMINFLEKKKQRAQLIPVLSTLLQCEEEDRARLCQL
ncbi:hypothetical protein K501DRAFT_140098, partial [Backusella circina FSU 941]